MVTIQPDAAIERKTVSKKYILVCMIWVILPAVLAGFMTLYSNGRILSYPQNSDEVCWYQQVKAVVEYGRPLGYYGYNETHAALGTLGAWGIAPLIPYAIMGKLIGMHWGIMSFCNIVFLCAANLIFLVATKIDIRKITYLIFVNVFLYVNTWYTISSMSECLRYSLSIIICGLFIRLLKSECSNWFKYGIIPLVILMSSFVYLMFVSLIPIYVYIILRERKGTVRLLASICSTALIAVTILYLTNMVACPYPYSKMGEIFVVLQNSGIVNAVKAILQLFGENIKALFVKSLINSGQNLVICYLCSYFIMMVAFVCAAVWNWWKKKTINYVSVYILNIFLFGFLFLYTSSYWTLIRGINVALIFAMYWCVAAENLDADRKVLRKDIVCFCVLGIIGMGVFLDYYKTEVIPYRVPRSEYVEQVSADEEILSKYIEISEEKSEWENTVVVYRNSELLVAALPAGTGVNAVIDYRNTAAEKSGYLLISKTFGDYGNIKIDRNKYEILYEDSRMMIYGRR